MADSGSIRAGKAYVELYGKDDALKGTLAKSEKDLSTWGQRITAVGKSVGAGFSRGLSVVATASTAVAGGAVAALGLLGTAARSFAENADRLSRLSKTGITTDDLKTARKFQLAMSTLGTSLQAAWAQVGAAVAPILTKVLNGVSRVVQGVTKWLAANRPLVASVAKIIAKVALFAAGLAIAAKVALVVGGFVAAIANPFGILAAILVAGVALWARWSESGQASVGFVRSYIGSTVAWLQERFGQLYKDFGVAWEGIVAAVSKGDLATAAEIAFTMLKLAFFETVKALGGNWNTFYTSYLNTVALIGDAWDVLFTRIKQGWRSAQNFLAKGVAIILGVLEGKTAAERQQVLDELDAMKDFDNNAEEEKLQKKLTERQKKLSAELAALPESDGARIAELRQKLENLAKYAKEGSPATPQFYAPRNIQTAGTFNAAAIRGVAGGGPLDKIAKNTEETAKNTGKMAKNAKGGPKFGGAQGGQ